MVAPQLDAAASGMGHGIFDEIVSVVDDDAVVD